MLLAGGIVHAQSTRYVYDANGRVVAVTQSSGTTTQYGYDALGYVGSISAPLSAGQLAIFAFTPTQGDAGTFPFFAPLLRYAIRAARDASLILAGARGHGVIGAHSASRFLGRAFLAALAGSWH
ncbi:hypothetical protein WT08_22200 [Burkholderia sp. MSMB1552]|nr:hypothetical protein WT08_22200 [Burkholderia sp. MSMB1552]KWZ55745.1 hypothetical protein WS92_07350 [Burkholderia sp. MSMB1588]